MCSRRMIKYDIKITFNNYIDIDHYIDQEIYFFFEIAYVDWFSVKKKNIDLKNIDNNSENKLL